MIDQFHVGSIHWAIYWFSTYIIYGCSLLQFTLPDDQSEFVL